MEVTKAIFALFFAIPKFMYLNIKNIRKGYRKKSVNGIRTYTRNKKTGDIWTLTVMENISTELIIYDKNFEFFFPF